MTDPPAPGASGERPLLEEDRERVQEEVSGCTGRKWVSSHWRPLHSPHRVLSQKGTTFQALKSATRVDKCKSYGLGSQLHGYFYIPSCFCSPELTFLILNVQRQLHQTMRAGSVNKHWRGTDLGRPCGRSGNRHRHRHIIACLLRHPKAKVREETRI